MRQFRLLPWDWQWQVRTERRKDSMKEKKTGELEHILNRAHEERELQDYLSDPENLSSHGSFPDYFHSLLEEKDISRVDIVKNSGIDRTYVYQILSGKRRAGRDRVLALCLAAGLTLEETQRCLKLAGQAPLYVKNRRDAILIFAVNTQLNVMQTEELLDEYGEKLF